MTAPSTAGIVGQFHLGDVPLGARPAPAPVRLPLQGHAWLLAQVLTPSEVTELRARALAATQVPVGIDGIHANFSPGDVVGALRCSSFSDQLAAHLTAAMPLSELGQVKFGRSGHTDWDGHQDWVVSGVNPLFRFIQYPAGSGRLVTHYDGPYIPDDTTRSLFSVVLYLTDHAQGGATRFVRDAQDSNPFEARSFSDWPRNAHLGEVVCQVAPRAGDVLVFEHRLLHDGEAVPAGENKLIARTDLMFSRGRR